MTTIEQSISTYIESRRWAHCTRIGNRLIFAGFLRAVDPHLPVGDLSHEHVAAWWHTQAHLAAATARRKHVTVSNWLRWCRHVELLAGDPMWGIERPREPRRSPVTLNPDEMSALFAVARGTRGQLIVTLMAWLGLRCVDVSRLQIGDVDLSRRMVTVTGKGMHVDLLPIPDAVAAAVRRYLGEYPAAGGPLLRTYSTPERPLRAQRISDSVAGWMRDAGVKQGRFDGRGAHALRRTCATDLLDRGANLRQVQAVMRHESLSSTERYLRRADAEELRAVVERDIA